jgi:hypothetical protein
VFVLDFGFSSLFSELPGVDPEFHKKCRMLLVVDLRRQFVERLLNVLQLNDANSGGSGSVDDTGRGLVPSRSRPLPLNQSFTASAERQRANEEP